jgi:hypothetical protein
MKLNFQHHRAFQERAIPAGARLVGSAALVQALSLKAPVRHPSCVSEKQLRGSRRPEDGWIVFEHRYWPGDAFADHLAFAIRHEPIDLLVLKRLFESIEPHIIAAFVRASPRSIVQRRVWFFYEFLTGRVLDVPDSPLLNAIDALDPKLYFTGKPRISKRHRIRDNLLGTPQFCPVIRQTEILSGFLQRDLRVKAGEIVGRTRPHLIARAASFMLLADSRASFEIEGERPPRGRLERWGRAVLQAGKNPLTLDEILRLHSVLIEDTRFVQRGLRPDGVFLGERTHDGDPLPEFIGAKPQDVEALINGLFAANDRMRESDIDAVLQAAATSFGFVYIHPFQDGNGRLHRCLIHHVLAERKFTPPGMIFPVSSVMLTRIDEYREALRAHSGPLMHFIEWRPTATRNVEVLNDTADLYRYFDCTRTAEYLYACVERTIEHDLPKEIDYLKRHDEAMRRIMDSVEMPDQLAESLIIFIRKNEGKLGRKRRQDEFAKLTDDEVKTVEAIVREAFEGYAGTA